MQNWVNFSGVKHSIPFAPMLRQYHVELRRSGRDQYRGCCPIHGGQSRDAFHVNLTKNVFHYLLAAPAAPYSTSSPQWTTAVCGKRR